MNLINDYDIIFNRLRDIISTPYQYYEFKKL